MHCLTFRLWFGTEGANADKLVELGTLFWVLIMNDFAVKYALIIIKSVITLIPKTVINYQRKVCLGTVTSSVSVILCLYCNNLHLRAASTRCWREWVYSTEAC